MVFSLRILSILPAVAGFPFCLDRFEEKYAGFFSN